MKRIIGILKTDEEILNIVESSGYKLIKTYHRDKDKKKNRRVIIEDKFGYLYDTVLYGLENYKRDFVNKSNPYSLSNIDRWLFLNNKNFRLNKENVYPGSHPLLSFHCNNCDDEFNMCWSHVITGHECSVCSGQQVGKHHSLYDLRPDLMEEWDYNMNNVSPKLLTLNSSYRAHWKCKNGYGKWESNVYKRTWNKHGCPFCEGNWLSDLNRLSLRNPELSKEWNKIKNGFLNPRDVSYNSGKKVWWKCSICSYEYKSLISDRNNGKGCPNCSMSGNEQEIVKILKKLNIKRGTDYITGKTFKDCKNINRLPFDFYFIKINLMIEFHGQQHYGVVNFGNKSTQEALSEFEKIKMRDKIKYEYCLNNFHNLLVIPYWDFKNMRDMIEEALNNSNRR